MQQYLQLLDKVLQQGESISDRTGTGIKALFGEQMRFDLREGFPLLTTKKLHIPSIIHELLWFLRGEESIDYLKKNKVRIWDEWTNENGNLGPVYGVQWRKWNQQYDQIATLIEGIIHAPFSRRHIVSAWNVSDLEAMALPPCHLLFQMHVHPDREGKPEGLSCQLYQRSADLFLGVPFNIASYGLLTSLIAQVTGLEARFFVHSFGNVHLYKNHLLQAQKQLERLPKTLPRLRLNPEVKAIDDFIFDDITIENYHADPHIKGCVSV